jgi:hypothetical protein
VGVNSIGEEINIRKVIPPGFVMILWEEKDTISTSRPWGRKEGIGKLSGLLRGEGPTPVT